MASREPLIALLKVQQGMDEEVRRDLLGAAEAIEHRIQSLLEGPGVGKLVRRSQLVLVMRAIREELVALFGEVDGDLQRALDKLGPAVAQAEATLDGRLWDKVGGPPPGWTDGLAQQARAGIRNYKSRRLHRRTLSQRVYHTRDLATGLVSRTVDQGLLQGLSPRELAREVRKHVQPTVRGGVSYAAMRLARTELNNAMHHTQQELRKDSPFVTGFAWNLSKSHGKRTDTCNELRFGGPYPKDAVPDKPHPHCFCYLTPAVVEDDDFVETFLTGGYDDYLSKVLGRPVQTRFQVVPSLLPGETAQQAKARRARERKLKRKAEEEGKKYQVDILAKTEEETEVKQAGETAAQAKARRAKARRERRKAEVRIDDQTKDLTERQKDQQIRREGDRDQDYLARERVENRRSQSEQEDLEKRIDAAQARRLKRAKAKAEAPKARDDWPAELYSLHEGNLRKDAKTPKGPLPDTDKPIKVREAFIDSHGSTSYKMNGWLIVKNGLPMAVEKSKKIRTAEDAERQAGIIRRAYETLPEEERKWTTQVRWLARRNPADSYWAKQYHTRGFLSAATAGNGPIQFWARDKINADDLESIRGTIAHENGHNMDTANNLRGTVWQDAVDNDLAWGPDPGDFKVDRFAQLGQHPITPGQKGVTTYGQNAIAEDIAEAARLYLLDRERGYLPGVENFYTGKRVRFKELWPGRAAILDQIFTGKRVEGRQTKRQLNPIRGPLKPSNAPGHRH